MLLSCEMSYSNCITQFVLQRESPGYRINMQLGRGWGRTCVAVDGEGVADFFV